MLKTIIQQVVVLALLLPIAARSADETTIGGTGAGSGQAASSTMRITGVFPSVVTAGDAYKEQPYEVNIVGENLPTDANGLFVAQEGQGLRKVIDVLNLAIPRSLLRGYGLKGRV